MKQDDDYEFEIIGKSIPEFIILDIKDALKSLLDYIDRDYGNKYLSVNDFVNSILQTVCTDNPEDGLTDFLTIVYDNLIDEDFEPGDIYDILTETELLGSIIIKEFQMLGFYKLQGFWGYQIQTWLGPNNIVLGYGIDFEMENVLKRIKVHYK